MIRFEWRILLTDSGMGRETDKKKISLEHEQCRTKIYICIYARGLRRWNERGHRHRWLNNSKFTSIIILRRFFQFKGRFRCNTYILSLSFFIQELNFNWIKLDIQKNILGRDFESFKNWDSFPRRISGKGETRYTRRQHPPHLSPPLPHY